MFFLLFQIRITHTSPPNEGHILVIEILYAIDAYKHIDSLLIGKLLIGISYAIDVYKHIDA